MYWGLIIMKNNTALTVLSGSIVINTLKTGASEFRLPRLISDGMVIQRHEKVNIWGWGIPGENVTIEFLGETYSTIAADEGKWNIGIPPQKAGGPYKMTITCNECREIKDILIGEVWLCSGQSNMVLPMGRVNDLYQDEIRNCRNDAIRLFKIPDRWDFNTVHEEFDSGIWQKTNPIDIMNFSATAYFFAKKLFDKYHVPIGLINASVGGTPVEAWMSKEALESFPEYLHIADKFKDNDYIERIKHEDEAASSKWYSFINETDMGLVGENTWFNEKLDVSDWINIKLPSFWSDEGLGAFNGVVWYRKEINISTEMAGKPARLLVGRIVDSDTVYVNGVMVGTTSYQYPPRRYVIPENVLKEGKNIIVVRVVNVRGRGGFIKDKPYKVISENGEIIELTGEWKCKIGVVAKEPLQECTFFQYKPTGLFNGMIAPAINYTIKGAIWYQGESNTSHKSNYEKLFSELIYDLRKKWGQGNFPFIYVQLANYLEIDDLSAVEGWPEIREAQLKTLAVPNTGMAVTIDVGEWNDLHPLNKKEVGSRLALWAQKLAYGDNEVIYSSPIFKNATVKGNKIVIRFAIGCGKLISKDGRVLQGFTIAGEDEKFLKAKAIIKDKTIEVWNDKIENPVEIRYAWADNPEALNLYNEAGLPASPFRQKIN